MIVEALGFDHKRYIERPTHRLIHVRLGHTSRLERLFEIASQDESYEARLVTLQGGDYNYSALNDLGMPETIVTNFYRLYKPTPEENIRSCRSIGVVKQYYIKRNNAEACDRP